jgi:hypothetical protein
MQSDPKLMQQMIDRMGSLDSKVAGGISAIGGLTSTFAQIDPGTPNAITQAISSKGSMNSKNIPVENEEGSPEKYDDAVIEADRKNFARSGSRSTKNGNIDPRR